LLNKYKIEPIGSSSRLSAVQF